MENQILKLLESENVSVKFFNFVKENIKKFGLKKSKDKVLQFNAESYNLIKTFLTKEHKDILKIGKSNEFSLYFNKKPFKIRQSGKAVSQMCNPSEKKSSGSNTNYQEIGVLVWLMILDKGGEHISDFKPEYAKNIYTDNPKFINETIDFLEKNTEKWNENCQWSAEVILKKIGGNLNGYQLHQGGEFFNNLRQKIALPMIKKVPGFPSGSGSDKWNPSDIYLVTKTAIEKLDLSKKQEWTDIFALNSYLADFKDIIGVSLKKDPSLGGAMHGAIGLQSLMKMLKFGVGSYNITQKKGPLSKETKNKLLKYLTIIKKLPCPYNLRIAMISKENFTGKESIEELLNKTICDAEAWGYSLPVILGYFTHLETEDDWKTLVTNIFALASSTTNASAPHWKVEGKHFSIQTTFEPDKLEVEEIRIPLSGVAKVFIYVKYKGHPKTIELRPKGQAPQGMIVTQGRAKTSFNKPLSSVPLRQKPNNT